MAVRTTMVNFFFLFKRRANKKEAIKTARVHTLSNTIPSLSASLSSHFIFGIFFILSTWTAGLGGCANLEAGAHCSWGDGKPPVTAVCVRRGGILSVYNVRRRSLPRM